MVVNRAHGKNISKKDGPRTIRLTFCANVEKIERLNRLTGLVSTFRTTKGDDRSCRLNIQLEGGTGDLFKWTIGKPWALRSSIPSRSAYRSNSGGR